MPVRIYDISKKLGLENKEVLAKAKELGIAAAKVPSSSLDKITAEYLETQLSGGRTAPAAVAPPLEPEKIILVTEPPPVPTPIAPAPEPGVPIEAKAPPVAPPAPADVPNENGTPVGGVVESPETTAPASPEPIVPAPPPLPTGPQVGDKVGFIQLPGKAPARGTDKPGSGSVKLPPSRPGFTGGR
ncbi:MAG TPA: translation initiation factor IF-2 N-terminal domain-containing protein, partial [Verrucomicrobiae bacterium]|nr:translation initiation factor IF-2 N-terminal domain-containing protein [Verrucomicrobiae bacterium]